MVVQLLKIIVRCHVKVVEEQPYGLQCENVLGSFDKWTIRWYHLIKVKISAYSRLIGIIVVFIDRNGKG